MTDSPMKWFAVMRYDGRRAGGAMHLPGESFTEYLTMGPFDTKKDADDAGLNALYGPMPLTTDRCATFNSVAYTGADMRVASPTKPICYDGKKAIGMTRPQREDLLTSNAAAIIGLYGIAIAENGIQVFVALLLTLLGTFLGAITLFGSSR